VIRLVGGLVFAGVLWVLNLRLGAALVVVAVLALSLISIVSPTAGTRIDVGIAKVTAPIARSVATILLAIVYFLVITPASLFLRLFGRDPLISPAAAGPAGTWVVKPRSDTTMVRRQFTLEPGASAGTQQGRAATAARLLVVMVSALVLLMAVDLTLGTAYVSVRGALDSDADRRASTAAMVNESWAADYFEELHDVWPNRFAWTPLLGLTPPDYEGTYINIADRARATYVAEGEGDDATSVYFFGGSTAWGYGQRDSYTIPSYLARLAQDDGRPVRVTNYGQPAWVIWQELSLLQQLLAEGNVPDVAVFYNGHNEVGQQVQELTADPSYLQASSVKNAVDNRRLRGSLAGLMDSFKGFYKRHSILVRGAEAFRSESSGLAPTPLLAETRARNAVELHHRAVEVIERLAESYGFEAVFIWQPDAYTTEGGDAASFTSPDREGFGQAYLDATALLGPPILDLSDSLDGVKDAVFIDEVHTNELGAEIVARAIYPHLSIEP